MASRGSARPRQGFPLQWLPLQCVPVAVVSCGSALPWLASRGGGGPRSGPGPPGWGGAPRSSVPWFVKTETFLRPYAAMRPHLAAHRAWVSALRDRGVPIVSGYLVDGEGRPGGGGLLLLEADSHAAAEALVLQDPMVRSGGVDWRLCRWVAAVGDLALAPEAPRS